jgi:hypothetical protein
MFCPDGDMPTIPTASRLQHSASLASLGHRQIKQPPPLPPRQFLASHHARLFWPAIVEASSIPQQPLRPDRFASHTFQPGLVKLEHPKDRHGPRLDDGDDTLIKAPPPNGLHQRPPQMRLDPPRQRAALPNIDRRTGQNASRVWPRGIEDHVVGVDRIRHQFSNLLRHPLNLLSHGRRHGRQNLRHRNFLSEPHQLEKHRPSLLRLGMRLINLTKMP